VRLIDPSTLEGRERYQLMTSLVVPRPIGWISTWSAEGVANLAPYSYFAALSASPMLVGVSIGHRRDGPKDTLTNVRSQRAFCVNVVSERLLEAMNATSADVAPDVDEFELAGLTPVPSDRVAAPYVHGGAAVLECVLRKEVDLEGARNTLVIGEVVGVRLDPSLTMEPHSHLVAVEELRPVGRLAAEMYTLLGVVRRLPRPKA
jgi:flavin reductase (DIM6/NTAB) family NADH-FMN oxidoreductase RutF